VSQVNNVLDALKDESSALDGASGIAEERVRSISRVFRQQAEELTHASEQAAQEIAKVGGALERQTGSILGALNQAGDQAEVIGETFAEQAKSLSEAATVAESQADRIRQNSFDARRDMFLRASKFVIEDLNSTAIDLNRVLDSEKTQKMWPKFAKGDRGIFVRGILSEDEREARDVIQSKYERDDDFRKYVSRYIEHFEKLLTEANESDPENLLSSTFLSADVGKLYLLLARAVGRLN
jgi:hypothetical protein